MQFDYVLKQSQSILNIIIFLKAEFMGELLYWITLDCKGVPHEASECILSYHTALPLDNATTSH